MEKVIHWSAGWSKDSWKDDEPEPHVLQKGWEDRLGGKAGWLKSFVVVRPAILTDGEELDEYKIGEDLADVWKWEGKAVTIGS
ncbi:hypothetical protein FRB90_003632 [Tulasnella sp. 427]|nr:hypothetical protein FRB90_003632 [Tulasnella sp. 427]